MDSESWLGSMSRLPNPFRFTLRPRMQPALASIPEHLKGHGVPRLLRDVHTRPSFRRRPCSRPASQPRRSPEGRGRRLQDHLRSFPFSFQFHQFFKKKKLFYMVKHTYDKMHHLSHFRVHGPAELKTVTLFRGRHPPPRLCASREAETRPPSGGPAPGSGSPGSEPVMGSSPGFEASLCAVHRC